MIKMIKTIIVFMFCDIAIASPCNHSHLTLHNETQQTLRITALDTQSQVLFISEPHGPVGNLAPGAIIPPQGMLVSKIFSTPNSMAGMTIRMLLTTDDQQTIEFTGIFIPSLVNKSCRGYLLGDRVYLSDAEHYSVFEQVHYGKPAVLDVKILKNML